MKKISRKKFLKYSSAAALSVPLLPLMGKTTFNTPSRKNPICIFSKHLQWLDFEDLGKYVMDLGFDGVDLTVRKGGHIKPEEAATKLPKALEQIRKSGAIVPMMATNINDPDHPLTESILKVAGENEIEFYRMAYLKYDRSMSIQENLLALRPSMAKLAQLNEKYGIHGAYQNHDGNSVGASLWDIWYVIMELDPRWIGIQFDPRHATVEGGKSWVNDLNLIKKFVKCSVAKDFHWSKDETGEWKVKNVPIGDGMVDFKQYLKLYKDFGINGPISVHVEYPIFEQEEHTLSKKQKMKFAREVLAKDLGELKQLLDAESL